MHSLNTPDDPGLSRGIVCKKNKGYYHVYVEGRTIPCVVSSKLNKFARHSGSSEHAEMIAVGDQVHYVDASGGAGMIVGILPRRNKLARRAAAPMPSAHASEQIMAANVDQVVPVFAVADPTPKWNMLDRYLVAAEAAGLPARICINKLDLAAALSTCAQEELGQVLQDYQRIGYPVISVSAITGEGLQELESALADRLSVLVGKSGVGKTSLLNVLQPGLGLRVKEVSQATGKGKHTTSHLEMFPLERGGGVIDTPGEREFGLWDTGEDNLALLFPEMRQLVGQCKFRLDCRHNEEPGCVIRQAVMAGQISPRRYQSYLRLAVETGGIR